MALYLLESSLCWLLFYGFYALTLSRETFFQLNRWYLLSTLALGAIIPHLEIPAEWVMQAPEVTLTAWLPMAEVDAMPPMVVVTATSEDQAFNIWSVLTPVYWIGVAFAGLRFLLGVSQIFRLYFKGEKIRYATHTLVLTDPERLPFSFGSWLFVSRENRFSDTETEKIIAHELAHIRGRHTADVLLMEIFCILLWWSPAIYLYRRSLRTVHEYLADHAVLRTARRKEYGHLLIRQAQSGMQPVLANHFFHSQLKKRIKMMTKTKSGKPALAKYLTVFPLLILTMLLFANREALAQANFVDLAEQPTSPIPATTDDENYHIITKDPVVVHIGDPSAKENPLFIIDGEEVSAAEVNALDPGNIERIEVMKGEAAIALKGARGEHGVMLITTKKTLGNPDEMPLFPGCEETDLQTRRDCAQKKLMEFIVANLKYPQSAQEAKLEGYVIASFVVNADGSIGKTEIITKTFCKACEEEVQRVIDLMPRWVPAQKDGKAVAAKVNLPIKFAPDAKFSDSPVASENSDPIFKVVEEMPRFPGAGCENSELAPAAKQECAAKAMLEFIYKNLKYPKAAREAGVEGTAVVSFVVDQSGEIRDAKIVRSTGGGCDEEVLRLVGEMPDWIPGKQRGQAVNVQFNLPIRFKLDAPAPKAEENTTPQPQPAYPVKEGNWEPAKFSASPNPASNQFRLYFEADIKPLYVSIMDAANKGIFEENVQGFNGIYDKTISLAGVPKGLIKIIVIQEGSRVYYHKLIVQ